MQETQLQSTSTSSDSQPKFSVPVDPEHAALRLAIIVVFFGAAILGYVVTNTVLQGEGFNIIALVVGIAAGIGGMQVIDSVFKSRWPSGRTLEIEGSKIRLALRGKVQREIDGDQHVNVMMWRFDIKRRARAPKGWFVIALALMQDDLYIPVYTFISPEEFKALPLHEQYVKLSARKDPDHERDMRVAGQQRRLLNAEAARWNEGAEVVRADFEAFVARLRSEFPTWMPAE